MSKWIQNIRKSRAFRFAIPIGFVLTILGAIGVALGSEAKDVTYGNKFNWGDIFTIILGGFVGQILQLIVIYVLLV